MKPRAHILFPVATEVRRNTSEIFSDHLLLCAQVRFDDKKKPMTLLTLNVLGPNASMCGFYPQGGWETEIDTKSRYTRIAESLAKSAKAHQVDVICLQETSPKHLLPLLRRYLKDGWIIAADEKTGLITCYNSNRFLCDPVKDIHYDHLNRIAHLKLHDKADNIDVTVCNVWGIYDPFPQKTEEIFKAALNQNPYTILMGDTNSRIAPIDHEPRNITTAIIPLLMNRAERVESDTQRSDYPDGGFYRGIDGAIHQLTTSVLDFKTGAIVNDTRTATEMQASTECRMILCLDDHYAHHPVIDGKTIGQYQEWLSHHLADKIEVRMAADCYNRKALAMCFAANSNFYKYLVSQLNKNPGFKHQRIAEANESGRSFPVIFMSLEYLDDLVKTIQSFNAEQNAVPHNGVRMFEGGVVNEVEKKPESTSVITKRIV